MPAQPVSRRALLLLSILMLVWGTNWPLFPVVVREVSVWTFRSISMPIAGLLLLAISAARGQTIRVPRRHWPMLVAASICYLAVWNVASTYAAVLLPSGQAAVLGFTMPLWAALIGWAVLGERLTGRLVIAVLLGAAAVTLLMVPNFAHYADAPLGLALGLLAGLGWAAGTLIVQRARIPLSTTVLTGWQLLVAAVPVVSVSATIGDYQWFMPSWTSIAAIAYITVVPMCIGNVTWFSIAGLLPASVAGLSSIMVPVIAMLTGALLLDEPLGLPQWLAMGCCAAALRLALYRPGRTVS